MAKVADEQVQEPVEGEAPAADKPKAEKKPSVYNVFETGDDGSTLIRINKEDGTPVVIVAPTADRARREAAKGLLKDEGQYVNVVAVAAKSLTVERFGIERPEPRLVAAS